MSTVRALILALGMASAIQASAATAGPQAPPQDTDAKLTELRRILRTDDGQTLLKLLADQSVRDQLASDPRPSEGRQELTISLGQSMADALSGLRVRLLDFVASLPTIPDGLAHAFHTLSAGLPPHGWILVGLYLLAFVAGGQATAHLTFHASKGWRAHLSEVPMETPRQRLNATGERLLFGLTIITATTLGSLGTFLLFDWPPMTGTVILAFLTAYVVYRLAYTSGRFLFAPGAERMRLVPMDTGMAWFWHRILYLSAALIASASATASVLKALSMPEPARHALALLLGLAGVVGGIWTIWAWQAQSGANPSTSGGRRHVSPVTMAVSLLLPLAWLAFVGGADEAGWTILITAFVPIAVIVHRRAVDTILNGNGIDGQEGAQFASDRAYGVLAVRGGQTVILMGTAVLLAHVWHLDVDALSAADTPVTRLARGALEAAVIALLFDVIWQVLRAVIDTRLAGAETCEPGSGEDRRRQARAQTLLPVLRNMLLIAVIAERSIRDGTAHWSAFGGGRRRRSVSRLRRADSGARPVGRCLLPAR